MTMYKALFVLWFIFVSTCLSSGNPALDKAFTRYENTRDKAFQAYLDRRITRFEAHQRAYGARQEYDTFRATTIPDGHSGAEAGEGTLDTQLNHRFELAIQQMKQDLETTTEPELLKGRIVDLTYDHAESIYIRERQTLLHNFARGFATGQDVVEGINSARADMEEYLDRIELEFEIRPQNKIEEPDINIEMLQFSQIWEHVTSWVVHITGKYKPQDVQYRIAQDLYFEFLNDPQVLRNFIKAEALQQPDVEEFVKGIMNDELQDRMPKKRVSRNDILNLMEKYANDWVSSNTIFGPESNTLFTAAQNAFRRLENRAGQLVDESKDNIRQIVKTECQAALEDLGGIPPEDLPYDKPQTVREYLEQVAREWLRENAQENSIDEITQGVMLSHLQSRIEEVSSIDQLERPVNQLDAEQMEMLSEIVLAPLKQLVQSHVDGELWQDQRFAQSRPYLGDFHPEQDRRDPVLAAASTRRSRSPDNYQGAPQPPQDEDPRSPRRRPGSPGSAPRFDLEQTQIDVNEWAQQRIAAIHRVARAHRERTQRDQPTEETLDLELLTEFGRTS